MNWTWPFATLEADDGHISIKVAGRVYTFTPDQVVSLTVGRPRVPLSSGLEIDHLISDYPKPFVFWTFAADKLYIGLSQLGFRVSRGPLSLWA